MVRKRIALRAWAALLGAIACASCKADGAPSVAIDAGEVEARTPPAPPPSDCRATAPLLAPIAVAGLEALGHKPLVAAYDAAPAAPSFVLYEDGLIVFTRAGRLVETTVAPLVVKSFVATIARAGFASLAPSYTCTDVAGAASMRILVRADDGWMMSAAYGVHRASCARAVAPFAEACRRIAMFDDPIAKTWVPEDDSGTKASARVSAGAYLDNVIDCLSARSSGRAQIPSGCGAPR